MQINQISWHQILVVSLQTQIQLNLKFFIEEPQFVGDFSKYIMYKSFIDQLLSTYNLLSFLALIYFNYWKNKGRRSRVATSPQPANKQNTIPLSMQGIIIIYTLVNKAAKPSIREETLATLLFYFILLPISIAMRVPIKLQGPLINIPTKKIVRQYGQGSSVSAQDTKNITTALINNDGLRNKALLLNKSARRPTPIPPITAPMSNIAQIYPFWSLMTELRSLRIVGSQNKSPYTQPLRQAQEKTQLVTLGRQRAEKIPYLKTLDQCYLFSTQFLGINLLSSYFAIEACYSEISDCWISQFFYFFGLSFIKNIINKAVTRPKPPVKTQFHKKLTLLSERTFRRAYPRILPTLLFRAQIPIKRPFLFQANQLLKIPTRPGHPVAWKNPLMHIQIVIKITLQKPVNEQINIQTIQKVLEIMIPLITQNFRENLCMRLPKTPIPIEQKARYRASTIPMQVFYI